MDTNQVPIFGPQGKDETHVEVLLCAMRDDRLSRRHQRVLAAMAALATPGRVHIIPTRAALAFTAGLAETTTAKTVSELIAFGYLKSEMRRIGSKVHPVAHYTLRTPPTEVAHG